MPGFPARIHLLPALHARTVIAVARIRSKLFHVAAMDAQHGVVEHGSWFNGRLYPMRMDLAPHGDWLVYLALGSNGKTWNGLSRAPWLHAEHCSENMGSWFGGGWFDGNGKLYTNGWTLPADVLRPRGPILLQTESYCSGEFGGEDLGVLYFRLLRDGWTRCGPNWGASQRLSDSAVNCNHVGDDGWELRPRRTLPRLHCAYAGYRNGYQFRFSWLDPCPIDLSQARWACWDAEANLWLACPGEIRIYGASRIHQGRVRHVVRTADWQPPPRITSA